MWQEGVRFELQTSVPKGFKVLESVWHYGGWYYGVEGVLVLVFWIFEENEFGLFDLRVVMSTKETFICFQTLGFNFYQNLAYVFIKLTWTHDDGYCDLSTGLHWCKLVRLFISFTS
jgi:hypothetical protein